MSDLKQLGPISLRISVTDRCQFRCFYCMPSEGVPKCDHQEILRFEEIVRFVRTLNSGFGLSKVHLTGGEPLLRPGIEELVAMLAAEGIADLALTTNGLGLSEMAGRLKRAGLARVNVSLDSIDAEKFATITRGGRIDRVLEGVEAARAAGLAPVKLNTVVMKGHNDADVADMARWALQRDCTIRFLELMPIGCVKPMFEKLFVPASAIRDRLAKCFKLKPLPHIPGSSSRSFLATGDDGLEGVIGFITPQTQPFCGECRRVRLTSTGRVLLCLARGKGPDVKALLRTAGPLADETLTKVLAKEMRAKTSRGAFVTDRPMVKVGG